VVGKDDMTTGKFFSFLAATGIMLSGAYSITWGNPPLTVTLFLCGVVLGGWTIIDSIWERHNDEIEKKTDLTKAREKFMTAVGSADSEARSFLSLEWPELGVMDVEIKPAIYILNHGMNTNILLSCFQRFLQDSDEREFADVRRYNDDKSLQDMMGMSRDAVRKQFEMATKYLTPKYLYPNSAQGSHSFLWISKSHYYRMVQWYIHGTSTLPKLGNQETI